MATVTLQELEFQANEIMEDIETFSISTIIYLIERYEKEGFYNFLPHFLITELDLYLEWWKDIHPVFKSKNSKTKKSTINWDFSDEEDDVQFVNFKTTQLEYCIANDLPYTMYDVICLFEDYKKIGQHSNIPDFLIIELDTYLHYLKNKVRYNFFKNIKTHTI